MDIVAEEMPTSGETTYLLTPPITSSPSTGAESATPTTGMEKSLLIFCIDTSGSMCVTTEVKEKETDAYIVNMACYVQLVT